MRGIDARALSSSQVSRWGLDSARIPARPSPPYAIGGTVTEVGATRTHVFTTDGTFTVTSDDLVASVLIVAGGGGGATAGGGGGGAGGLIFKDVVLTSGTSYSVTIGAGGTGGTTGSTAGGAGEDTVFGALTATGGGGGGASDAAGGNGGSGGGSGNSSGPLRSGGTGVAGQGFAGGSSNSVNGASGGGGFISAGVGTGSSSGGPGGGGQTLSISGSPVVYAAGGGGAATVSGGSGHSAGGNGGVSTTSAGGDATTPGSGGGGTWLHASNTGGAGADGIVIVRYAIGVPQISRLYTSDPRAGLVDWLATQGATASFTNPQGMDVGTGSVDSTGGLIWAKASSILNSAYHPWNLTDNASGTFFITLSQSNSWMWLSTGVFEFRPTHVALRQRSDAATQLYGNCTIAVSVDGSSWTDVGSITSPTQTTGAWNVASLTTDQWWQYIRATQTSQTNTADNYFCVGEFEFFGEMRMREILWTP